jgi:hypothetical protein
MRELLPSALPAIAIACGLIVLLLSQKDRLATLLVKFCPQAKTVPGLTPHELFERLYDLRSWCETSGKAEAVKAIDSAILPAIVQGDPKP